MKQKIYQVDAFTEELFRGNPAAVCPLTSWLPNELMQSIAAENNLAETAFFVREGERYIIRWFTPAVEVDLCGHATLAAAFVLFHHEGHQGDVVEFFSPRSGQLRVTHNDGQLTLNFPTDTLAPIELTDLLKSCCGSSPLEAYKGKTDYMLVFGSEEEIAGIQPKLDEIGTLAARGLIATAKGNTVDFVSRFFAPASGIDEDPVTGSAHTSLTPYWSEKLGKDHLSAIQLSDRRGYLSCRMLGDRVEISGSARLYLEGHIMV